MDVQHARALVFQPLPQAADELQGLQPLTADGPIQVVGAARANTVTQGALRGDQCRAVTTGRCKLGQFHGHQFRAAQVERNQGLDNMHGRRPDSVNQPVRGAAVRTGRRTRFLDRDIDTGVRIPELLFRRGA